MSSLIFFFFDASTAGKHAKFVSIEPKKMQVSGVKGRGRSLTAGQVNETLSASAWLSELMLAQLCHKFY